MQDRKFFTSMAAALFFMAGITTSCVNDDVLNQDSFDGRTPINFTSSVASRTTNQAIQETQIKEGNTVGVFIANVAETEADASTQPETTESLPTNNYELTADDNGNLTSNTPIYFPEGKETVDIYAYAPYKADFSNNLNNNVAFAVASDQSDEAGYIASDFMIAQKNSVPTNESNVILTFDHKMVKLNLNFNSSLSDQLKGATVTVSGVKTEANVNISTGTVTATDTETPITAAIFDETTNELTASVIFVPQTLDSGKLTVKVTKAGQASYEGVLNQNIEFKGGVRYTYNVELKNSTLVLTPTTSINGWEDTVISPYKVGDYVLADGTIVSSLDNKGGQEVKAIIFSTQVSETDAQNGYAAYAMWLSPVNSKKWSDSDELHSSECNVSNFTDAYNDLNGLKETSSITNSTYYQSLLSDQNYAFQYFTRDGNKKIIDNDLEGQFSQLFAPSIGQMIQILNNLGNAGITLQTQVNENSGTTIFTSEDNTAITTINNIISTADGTAKFDTNGEHTYITSTENDTKFWYLKTGIENGAKWGFGKNAGKTSMPRDMIPCIAIKLPTSTSDSNSGI